MKRLFSTLLLVASLQLQAQTPATALHLIPRPQQVEQTEGTFSITSKTSILCDASIAPQAQYLAERLSEPTGWDVSVKSTPSLKGRMMKNAITMVIDSASIHHSEGYQLEVNPHGILITAHDAAGAFYGVQTMLQLLPAEIMGSKRQRNITWSLPCVNIIDAPSHPWRGMMLDVARYFFHKDFVKKYIDAMATYKLNKLQFHLIDDSGWRLEIKKYPRLTEVGAWAGEGANRLGGYYTQDDIREIIDYAAVRGVEVIPEIEFPAHVLSAIVAYPWLSCTGQQHEVPSQHFISRDLLCAGKASTMQFIDDVLEETIAMFPSKYINIGGDEAVYTRWEQCPDCQALMKREGLKKASELQGYLTNVVAEKMRKKDRTVIGWEEIVMRGKVNTPVVALMWHDPADSIKVKADGHKSILTPCYNLYFDFPESYHPGEPQHATWCPPIPIEKTYAMSVTDYSSASSVIGVQGCFWSDQFIHGQKLQEINILDENRSERYAEYFTFPRLLALSELGWTAEAKRSYDDFAKRLPAHYARLDAQDVAYRLPEPKAVSITGSDTEGYTFTLEPNMPKATIHYTTDGSFPTVHSAPYTKPVTVARKSDFQAINVLSSKRYSLPLYTRPDYSAFDKYGTFTAEWKPLRVQLTPEPWHIDATGKISGNGKYEVSFIALRGENALQISEVEIWKRNEKLATATPAALQASPTAPATFSFSMEAFEAGTPFSIRVKTNGVKGNDTAGYVFVKKID